MLFPTFEFAVFFSLVFVGNWMVRPFPRTWRWFLIVASYIFYAWWDPRFTLLLAGSTVVNQIAALVIYRTLDPLRRRVILIVAVTANLGVLGFFKYYGFFLTSVSGGLAKLGFHTDPPLLQIVLPVGISFFTFQALSYVIDTYRGDTEPAPWLDFAAYLSFFPHLVAGPIVRARELLPQFNERADPRNIDSALAFRLIFGGLFKKVVISSFVASTIVDKVFANPSQHTNFEILFGIYGYAIQIYADFSGYTDIAIGCALLLGLRFPAELRRALCGPVHAEFLAQVAHDAVGLATRLPLHPARWQPGWRAPDATEPVPHDGDRRALARSGLDVRRLGRHPRHRADRRAFLERAPPRQTDAPPDRHELVLRWFITFHVVCLAWVFFRAESLTKAWQVLWGLLTQWGVGTLVTPMLVFVIVAMVAAQFVPNSVPERVQALFSKAPPVLQGTGLAFGFLIIDALGPVGVAPFIYFQF